MGTSTIKQVLIGGRQEASIGVADGGLKYKIILANGTPNGDVQPWSGACLGSEHKDCAGGNSYEKKAANGEDADWTAMAAPTVLMAVDPPPPPARKRKRKPKAGG